MQQELNAIVKVLKNPNSDDQSLARVIGILSNESLDGI